ncbi:hypothetical protein [Kytococcus sedentarius]|uniref:hypothetical protein n=1 Tax=Kytococcus sedentarius TaxID=1276 RepID=UPI0035BC69CF
MNPVEAVSPAHSALLWFSGGVDAVGEWLTDGVVAAEVAPGEGWTIVRPLAVPDGLGPYGDALGLTLSRPVPAELLPVIGFTEREDLLVVAAATETDPLLHWIAVLPGVGPHPLADLPTCGPRFLAQAAGAPDRADEVTSLVSRGRGANSGPREFGTRLALTLGLPGASLFRRPAELPGGELAEPDPREVQRFMSVLSDRLVERSEAEGDR